MLISASNGGLSVSSDSEPTANGQPFSTTPIQLVSSDPYSYDTCEGPRSNPPTYDTAYASAYLVPGMSSYFPMACAVAVTAHGPFSVTLGGQTVPLDSSLVASSPDGQGLNYPNFAGPLTFTVTSFTSQDYPQTLDDAYSTPVSGGRGIDVMVHVHNSGGQNAQINLTMFLIGAQGIEYLPEWDTSVTNLPNQLPPGQGADGVGGSFTTLTSDSHYKAIAVFNGSVYIYQLN